LIKGNGSGTKLNNVRKILLSTGTVHRTETEEVDFPEDSNNDMENFEELPYERMDTKDKLSSLMEFVIEKPITPVEVARRNLSNNPYPNDEFETDLLLKEEVRKYHRGKRWLATVMGANPETFSQVDVDRAIQYLLPSHLTEKDARPNMKHPYDVFPTFEKFEADEYGRPKRAAFFMRRTYIHDLSFQMWCHLERLHEIAKQQPELDKSKTEPEEINLKTKQEIEGMLNKEQISDEEYESLLFRFNRLVNHPCYHLDADVQKFVAEYTRIEQGNFESGTVKNVRVSEDGLTAFAMGYRKSAIADVVVHAGGSGKLTVNNKPMREYFSMYTGLEQIMHPFLVIGMLNKFDVEAQVIGGGVTGHAGAIRHGISRAIAGMMPEKYEALKTAGLLTKDARKAERQKPGQRGPRRAFQWVRR